MTAIRYHAPYMEWAKTRAHAAYDLGGSNILACTLDDLPGAADALALSGDNDNGYAPLMEAIAARYGVRPEHVTTASGTAGANMLAFAALLEPGDDVLVETPGYDPLLGTARLVGARTVRVQRTFESGYRLDPERVKAAMTPATKLIVVTNPHNPSGAAADPADIDAVADIAARAGAHVVVDEVYRDVSGAAGPPAATRSPVVVTTSSLTKSYGLSSLRCGWTIASEPLTYRMRRARDVVDGSGSIVTERLATLAFSHLDALMARARTLLARNTALVDRFLASRRELEYAPSAATVVFPRLRGVDDATTFAERLLYEQNTAVVPGRYFQAPAQFRLGFGGDTARLEEGLRRVSAVLDASAAR